MFEVYVPPFSSTLLVFCSMFLRSLKRLWRDDAPVKLGRWSCDASESVMRRRAELAVLDNCGTTKVKRAALHHDCFDSSMEISLCALQGMHLHPRRTVAAVAPSSGFPHPNPPLTSRDSASAALSSEVVSAKSFDPV